MRERPLGTAALYPRAAQKPDEVPVRDRLDVVLAISPRAKPFGDAGEVRHGLDLQGRLLAAETAVEVAADADVSRVAGNLTDVVGVIEQPIERHARVLGCARPALPAGNGHPRIERHADDGASLDEGTDLVIRELPVVRHEGTTVRMAGPHGTAKCVERLPEALVAEMRRVEDHPEPLHLAQELAAADTDSALRLRPLRVGPRSVMCRPNGAQAILDGCLEMSHRDDRIRTFEAEEVPHRHVLLRV